MGDIDKILEMVDPRFTVQPVDGEAMLEESDKSSTLKTIRITGLPRETCILKLEGQVGRFLREGRKERKCCDYIILTVLNGSFHLVFIELKSECPRGLKKNIAKWQLQGAECALDYLSSLLKTFHKSDNFLKSFNKRFFVIHSTPLNKRGSLQKFACNHAEAPHSYSIAHTKSSSIPFKRFVS